MTRNHVVPDGLLAAEQSVLGGILLRPDLLIELDLEVASFADPRHREVFAAMRNLEADSIAIDVTTLGNMLDRAGKFEAIGSWAYLGELSLRVPIPENVHHYAKFVRDEALKREVVKILASELERYQAGEFGGALDTGRELLDATLHALAQVDRDEVRDETETIENLTRSHIHALQAEAERRLNGGKAELTGCPTGVARLDECIGGWQFGIVSVICARPGHGKSSLGLASADASSARGIGVHVFSLEDPRKSYMNRTIARQSGIPISNLAAADLTREHLPMFTRAHHDLVHGKRPWLVDDRSGLTADDIIRSVRRHAKKNRTKLVIVDYLQLVKPSRHSTAKSKHESIGDTLNALADACKNDGMAYVIMSQLNREVEKRDDKRPQESDLRESGTIEERAKCIVAMYRGLKYYPDPRAEIDVDESGATLSHHDFMSSVQLLILKNSQGPAPSRVLAGWRGETTKVW